MRRLMFALVLLPIVPPLAAEAGGAASTSADERQIGDYVAPTWDTPAPTDDDDAEARGKPLPLPGFGDLVRHKPGAGVWLAEPIEGGHLYLNGKRSRMSVDLKLGF